ncbi:MAG: helix-turn-helix transcriptional regulator [Miltoncostaeaceae bacterium]
MMTPTGRAAARRLGLSHREVEVVEHLMAGRDTSEIAERLHLEPQTIRNITHRIGRKLGVSGRLRIVARAHELDAGTREG